MELLTTESTVAMDNPENIAINVKNKSPKNELSYDDILSNMGMCVKNGKLHLFSKNKEQNKGDKEADEKESEVKNVEINSSQHSYIYKKYFKDEFKQEVSKPRVPKNWIEYRGMLAQDILQRERIKKIKTKQIFYHNAYTNVNGSSYRPDLNKLFNFSHR